MQCARDLELVVLRASDGPIQHPRISPALGLALNISREFLARRAKGFALAERGLRVDIPCNGHGEL